MTPLLLNKSDKIYLNRLSKPFSIFKGGLILLFIIAMSSKGYTQGTDEQLARYYFDNQDYEKAKIYYEKLFDNNNIYYPYYFKTLLALKEFKEAEKVVKSQIKDFPKNYDYQIDLALIYETEEKPDKAEKQYQSIIDAVDDKLAYYEFRNLGVLFTNINKLDYALAVYNKGQKIYNRQNQSFALQIGEINGLKGDFRGMIDAYLDHLDKIPSQKPIVENYLVKSIDFETDDQKTAYLRASLLKRLQQQPNSMILSDMLIWYYQQKGDFESAFTQVKAQDRKTKSLGNKVMSFAQLCYSNEQYDLAIDAYDYIIDTYDESNYHYANAKRLQLDALKMKITTRPTYTAEDLTKVEQRYIETLNKLRNPSFRPQILKDLAYLQTFYIHNIDTAEILLEEAISTPGADKRIVAECKLDLADVLLIKNQIWDASLYYSQVEKSYTEDILGFLAKFKNAKLYYYAGDFEWAQSQLDALKASTTKLISNDAMDLSLLITDNYNMDTTVVNMQRFAFADLLIYQNKLSEATQVLDSLNKEQPEHSLSDEILFKRYEIAFKRKDFGKAKQFLLNIVEQYGDDILADNALFKLGEMEENVFEDNEKAKEYYKKLMLEYPASLYVVEARKRFRELGGGSGAIIK